VTGPGPERRSTRPAALIALMRVEKFGLTAKRSKTVQTRPHVPGGTWNWSVGGCTGRGGSRGGVRGPNPAKGEPNDPKGAPNCPFV
jgi:hypothetical protein